MTSKGRQHAGLVATIRVARRLARGLIDSEAFKSAAAVAFWLFLSLVPLLVFLGFLVGQVTRRRGVDALLGPLLDVIPAAAEAIVRDELERLAGRSSAPVAPVSVASYLWTASSGLHNLMDLFESMARARPRPYWKQRAIALVWVVGGLAAACVLALALVRFDSATRTREPAVARAASTSPAGPLSSGGTSGHSLEPSRGPQRARVPSSAPAPGSPAPGSKPRARGGLTTPLGQAFAATSMLVVGTLFLASFYRFGVERRGTERRRVWPGTAAALACWLGVSWGFSAYVASIADYALFYGSLAAVAVLLIWLYLTSLSLIVGAEVNALASE
jgi:membrane protein